MNNGTKEEKIRALDTYLQGLTELHEPEKVFVRRATAEGLAEFMPMMSRDLQALETTTPADNNLFQTNTIDPPEVQEQEPGQVKQDVRNPKEANPAGEKGIASVTLAGEAKVDGPQAHATGNATALCNKQPIAQPW